MNGGSTPGPRTVTSPDEARSMVLAARAAGKRVALVPTMGALHEGHLSLVDAARSACQFTAVTIFVNPTQFAPHEDLAKYPRTLDDDLRQLAARGVDLVFTPATETMYPPGASTFVEPGSAAERWEGVVRPGHFRGVATIVLKIFNILPADVAYFGQKDWQQTRVIRQMIQDLNVPIDMIVCPTVRESDGLAMSSRNRYLSPDQRQRAAALSRALRRGAELVGRQHETDGVLSEMNEELVAAGIQDIDYLAIVDPETLEPLKEARPPLALLVAARVGTTRLIDNLLVT